MQKIARFLLGKEERHRFLSEFEAGNLPAEEWTHAAHLAMATVYLARYGDQVLPHTRRAIRNYLLARSKPVTNYHETLTVFWLAVVSEALGTVDGEPEDEAVLRMHETFGGDSKLYKSFYSFDAAASSEARARWVPPDLRALPVRFSVQPEKSVSPDNLLT